jgi:hypothetical protein
MVASRRVIAVVVVAVVGLAASTVSADSRRVRATDAVATALLTAGLTQSAVIGRQVAGLEASDLIVLIGTSVMPGTWRGITSLVGAGGGVRYVTVTVNRSLDPREQFAVLAHELQHVTELAGDRTVVDQAGVRALYARLGWATNSDGYETREAQEQERRMREEVRQRKLR